MKYLLTILTLCLGLQNVHGLVLEKLISEKKLVSTFEGKKIGYYLGSFDPLHLGHVATVQQVITQNLCNYVLIYPVWGGDRYKNRIDVKLRLDMLFAEFANHPNIIVTRLNAQQLQKALMKDSHATHDGKPKVISKINGSVYIGIVGSDAALYLAQDSKRYSKYMTGIQVPDQLRENTLGSFMALPVDKFIVSQRQGDNLDFLNNHIGDRPIIKVVMTDQNALSSTVTRARVKSGATLDGFTSPEVAEIIKKENLYMR